MDGVAVGIDVGGTSTRALAVDAAGAVLGRGAAGGANPNSHPPQVAAARVAEAVAAALGPRHALACVLGMAGASKLSDPAVASVFHAALADAGVRVAPRVVTDAEVAFVSGTAEPDGTVLIAGTGSIAMRITGRRRGTTVGGFGWLLGDEGSAYWIGREAVRATLRTLQSGEPHGPLAAAVLATALDGTDNAFARLITAVNGAAPIELARFAPLVSAHTTDPVAADIVTRAARALADQAVAARSPGPIVLAGTVAGPDNPVGVALREILAPEHTVETAKDGAAGAAWLAALDAFGPTAVRPRP
ncbi:N-acetylglucosamine kinase [Actinokineospora sp.]|uniref:N-acetylglucosamine kinase n=1 Tax=Actinokineospora sp. TaxID=1872133 RepID=UPI00403813EB